MDVHSSGPYTLLTPETAGVPFGGPLLVDQASYLRRVALAATPHGSGEPKGARLLW